MATNSPEPTPQPAGGLQSMLARLRGMVQALKSPETAENAAEDVLPTFDVPESAAAVSPPVALPVDDGAPPAEPVGESAPPIAELVESSAPAPPAQATQQLCPYCRAPRNSVDTYCGNCGWVFASEETVLLAPTPANSPTAEGQIKGRYEIGELIHERAGVCRYRGRDHGSGTPEPMPVVILRSRRAEEAPGEPAEESRDQVDADILADFEDPMTATVPMSQVGIDPNLVWPTIAWESAVLEKAQHPLLPRVLDSFSEGEFDYLIEESLSGRLLWDAWDDPAITVAQRFGWLGEVAEGLHGLHRAGAILEGLRPDIVAVTSSGHAVLTDVADLLPLPLPPNPPIRATHYTAPELVLASDHADARADLYSFGAMLYALHVGRELTEMDFEKQQGVPKAIIPTFPDVHPLFARLVSKTFTRDPAERFPTDEAAREDPTGFTELMRTLEHCRRSLATARLEIAAWTTTGMVRTGNEDAFGLLHAVESRQDDLGEYALVLLSDGMGGYEAGEVAAALAIQTMRKYLLQQKLFAALAGESTAPPGPFDVAICRQHLLTALKEANRNVYSASREGAGRRGMGCTAEVVYVDGRHVIVGHVGDSRTYHLHQGRMIQLTRDQTLVSRLLELGQLTPEEAEAHPRRSELQQAIGGRADVEPEIYDSTLLPGDWLIVCSDGLSNHVKREELQEMLQSEATSAEMAARRLVNLVNLRGATDNATVVVIRAT